MLPLWLALTLDHWIALIKWLVYCHSLLSSLLFVGDGSAWQAQSTTVSVAAKCQVQNDIALSGIFQTIQSGAFDYYEIDGQAATPNFTNGAWVVDVGGTYVFNIRGWAFTGSGSETQTRFYVGVNGNDYVSQPNVGIDAVTKNGSGLTLSGTVRLNAGDTLDICRAPAP